MLGVLLGIGPWILGCSAALLCATKPKTSKADLGIIIMLVGVGGVVSYPFLGMIIGLFDHFGFVTFRKEYATVVLVVGLTMLAFALIDMQRIRKTYCNRGHRPGTASLSMAEILTSAVLIWSMYNTLVSSVLAPIEAWDSFNWMEWAKLYLDFDQGRYSYEGISRGIGASFPHFHERHPMTIFYVSAYSAFCLGLNPTLQGWLFPWFFGWVSLALIVWGLGFTCLRSAVGANCMTYAALTIPLIENHAGQPGYLDFWIMLISVAAVASIAKGFELNSLRLKVAGILISFMALAIKNIGILYVLSIFSSWVIMELWFWNRFVICFLPVVPVTVLGFAAYFGFRTSIFGVEIGFMPMENPIVVFGGYSFSIHWYSPTRILENFYVAFSRNMSFSISALAVIMMAFVRPPRCNKSHASSINRSKNMCILSSLLLVLIFALPQLIHDYSTIYAEAGNDTGSSRFLMSFPITVILGVGYYLREADDAYLQGELA